MGNFDWLINEINDFDSRIKLFGEVKQIVNEVKGIRREVKDVSFSIIRRIREEVKAIEKKYSANLPGVSYRYGNFEFSAFDKKITVQFRYCNFRDFSYYRRYVNELPSFQNEFSLKTLTLKVDVHAISGVVDDRTLADTIHHEIHHYFQEDKTGKPFSDNPYYKIGVAAKNTYGKNDEVAERIGNMMYFSSKPEIEAYANGLYGLLVDNYKNKRLSTSSVIENSPFYLGILKLREDIKWLENNKDNDRVADLINAMRDKNNYVGGVRVTVEKLIKKAKCADREAVNRMGKAVVQAQEDCHVENDLETTGWK